MKDKKVGNLDELIKAINSEFGAGSSQKLGSLAKVDVDVIPTGSFSLDIALGVGGLPRGRIVEIFGPEASGKTTLALHVVSQAQKLGGEAAFIDVEHGLDPEYSKRIGVDMDHLVVSQPNSAEEALNLLQRYVESDIMDVVVVDSVAALVPQSEVEGNMGDQTIGLKARMMSQAMRKITPIVAKTGTVVIFINQIRMKIGMMTWGGNPETTPGGMALKFHSSVRLDIRRIGNVKEKEEIIGTNVKVKVAKNKVAAPFKTAEFMLSFGNGIERELDILNTAVLYGIVTKEGNTYMFDGEKIDVGLGASWKKLKENPELVTKIIDRIGLNSKKVERELKIITVKDSSWKKSGKYFCPECEKRIYFPDYSCKKCNIKVVYEK